MGREARIAVAAALWLLLLVPVYIYTIRVPRVQLDVARLERLEAVVEQPIRRLVKVAVVDEAVPDLAPACERHLRNAMRARGDRVQFSFSSECTPDRELCIECMFGASDALMVRSPRSIAMSYGLTSLVSKAQPRGVEYLLLDGMYNPIVDPPQSHPELTLRYTPRIHVVFSLFGEGELPLSWDIAEAVDEYLGPLLRALRTKMIDVTVETQVRSFAKIGCRRKTILRLSQLSTFVNFAEWSLSSPVTEPVLHFVLYAPDTPMILENTPSNSFLVSRWGGVHIARPGKLVFFKDELRAPLELFGKQLLILLGMREPEKTHGRPPAALRVDQLASEWALSGLRASVRSLSALRRLTQSVHTIPIPDDVRVYTDRSMDSVERALALLEEGDLASAAPSVAQAHDYAERAFFDRRMIAQAYFPDEQKLAVYIPLIGPLAIVVASAWLRIYRRARAQRPAGDTPTTVESAHDEKAVADSDAMIASS